MSLAKTQEGKEALLRRDPNLGPRERQVLVMVNGKISREEMRTTLRSDINAELEKLIRLGYVEEQEGSSKAPLSFAKQKAAGSPIVKAEPSLLITKGDALPSASTRTQSSARRSLAGTKMYIVDMLQLMRDMDASAMAVSIHTSDGPTEFMTKVADAARLITQKSGPSYGMRVIDKLHEIVPEAYIEEIDSLALELGTSKIEA